jgi:hypothetical protein
VVVGVASSSSLLLMLSPPGVHDESSLLSSSLLVCFFRFWPVCILNTRGTAQRYGLNCFYFFLMILKHQITTFLH